MTTTNPVFTITAFIAALICLTVMAMAGAVGKLVSMCRKIDTVIDKIFESGL